MQLTNIGPGDAYNHATNYALAMQAVNAAYAMGHGTSNSKPSLYAQNAPFLNRGMPNLPYLNQRFAELQVDLLLHNAYIAKSSPGKHVPNQIFNRMH